MAQKDEGPQFTNKLYSMDGEAILHIEEQHLATGISRSEIVRRSVKAYDVRSPNELKAKAAQLDGIADKKAAAQGS